MRRKKKNALVTFKICPKCNGSGKVPCDGFEHYREKSQNWARQLHLQPVVVRKIDKVFPGLAVKSVNPGGWGAVKVYVAVTDLPPEVMILRARHFEGDILMMCEVQCFDIINDRAFWHKRVSWGYRDDISILDTWPEMIQEMLRLTEGGVKLLEIKQ